MAEKAKLTRADSVALASAKLKRKIDKKNADYETTKILLVEYKRELAEAKDAIKNANFALEAANKDLAYLSKSFSKRLREDTELAVTNSCKECKVLLEEARQQIAWLKTKLQDTVDLVVAAKRQKVSAKNVLAMLKQDRVKGVRYRTHGLRTTISHTGPLSGEEIVTQALEGTKAEPKVKVQRSAAQVAGIIARRKEEGLLREHVAGVSEEVTFIDERGLDEPFDAKLWGVDEEED